MRRFKQHEQRRMTDLTGIWDFAFLGAVDPNTVKVEQIVFGDRMAAPSCFDAPPPLCGQAGCRGLSAADSTPR